MSVFKQRIFLIFLLFTLISTLGCHHHLVTESPPRQLQPNTPEQARTTTEPEIEVAADNLEVTVQGAKPAGGKVADSTLEVVVRIKNSPPGPFRIDEAGIRLEPASNDGADSRTSPLTLIGIGLPTLQKAGSFTFGHGEYNLLAVEDVKEGKSQSNVCTYLFARSIFKAEGKVTVKLDGMNLTASAKDGSGPVYWDFYQNPAEICLLFRGNDSTQVERIIDQGLVLTIAGKTNSLLK
jgi:hypothetical protein